MTDFNFKEKANLIWTVADLLRGDYRQSDYGKVILPMTVLRRLDCVLEPTKQKVLDYLPKVENLSDSAKGHQRRACQQRICRPLWLRIAAYKRWGFAIPATHDF